MATVTSKTSIKIDDLINEQIISGEVSSSGHLLLITRGGAVIDAGSVSDPDIGQQWKNGIAYGTNEIVGYAGQLWKATVPSTSKAPPLFTDRWMQIHGSDVMDWSALDPLFEGSAIATSYELFWRTGTTSVSLTNVAGEFETGRQAAKVALSASSSQRIFEFDENIVGGGEIITVKVRCKALSAGATLEAQLMQSSVDGPPEPFGSGAVQISAVEPFATPTTNWTTYTFTINTVNGKPRAKVHLLLSNVTGTPSTLLIDSIRTTRGKPAASAGTVFNFASTSTTWNCNHNLGRSPVDVTTFDTSGNEIVGDVHYVDDNNVQITWYYAVAGSAVVQ